MFLVGNQYNQVHKYPIICLHAIWHASTSDHAIVRLLFTGSHEISIIPIYLSIFRPFNMEGPFPKPFKQDQCRTAKFLAFVEASTQVKTLK